LVGRQAVLEDASGQLGLSWVKPAAPVPLPIAGLDHVEDQFAQMVGAAEKPR
jgi:hypothetical protein